MDKIMHRFKYDAVNSAGNVTRGIVDAASKEEARTKLKSSGLIATSLSEVKFTPVKKTSKYSTPIKMPSWALKNRMSRKELMVFTRQLSTLVESGVPLPKALSILEDQEEQPHVKNILRSMMDSMNGGTSVQQVFAEHPKTFPSIYVSMVAAGDASGKMDTVLDNLAEFMEKSEKIRSKVKSAMTYPCVVLFMAVAILMFLMTVIIPKFQDIFKDMLGGAELPSLTQAVMSTSYAIREHYMIILGVVALLSCAFSLIGRTKQGKAVLDRLMFKLPLFGNLSKKTCMARLSRTLGTLLSSGVQILPALKIVRDTTSNTSVSSALEELHEMVKEGEDLADSMRAHKVFPKLMVGMVKVGTSTGKTPDMLMKVAGAYENEVDDAVAGLTSTIEPLLIVLLAVMVGTIVIALFLPLISIISKLS